MGPKHPRWKGGKSVNKKSGYVSMSVEGKTVMEHRHIMSKILGRPLLRSEHVHHKDELKSNNEPDNLVYCATQKEHLRKFHYKNWTEDGRKLCSKCKEPKTVDKFYGRPDRNSIQSRCIQCMLQDRQDRREELNRKAREAYTRLRSG